MPVTLAAGGHYRANWPPIKGDRPSADTIRRLRRAIHFLSASHLIDVGVGSIYAGVSRSTWLVPRTREVGTGATFPLLVHVAVVSGCASRRSAVDDLGC
jgi:hypothetical protein